MFSNNSTQPNPGLLSNGSSGRATLTGSAFGAPSQQAAGTGSLFSPNTTNTGSSIFSGAAPGGTSTGTPTFGMSNNSFANVSASTVNPTTSTSNGATIGGGFFGNAGVPGAAGGTGNAEGSGFSLPTGNLFSTAKPAAQSSFGLSTAATPTAAPTTAGLFGNSPNLAETNTTPSTAPSALSGSLFSVSLFGNKTASGTPLAGSSVTSGGPLGGSQPNPTLSSTLPTAGGLFANKAETATSSASTLNSGPALPAVPPFNLSGSNSTTAPAHVPNFFGKNPEEKKDAAATPASVPSFVAPNNAAGENKGAPAAGAAPTPLHPLSGSKASADKKDLTAAGSTSATSSAVTPIISVQPPSILKGKSIEEIVNRWTNDLEVHVREFSKYASEVAVWDRALVENSNNLAALYGAVIAAEREQNDIDQSLDYVEQQQRDLSATLEVYEKATQEILGGQGGSLRALDTGPADTERDKNYMVATELHGHLDDLSGSLVQMIDSVNALSAPSVQQMRSGLDEDPMSQIAQILSSHLESLQWIEGAVREVEDRVVDIEKRVRGAGESGGNPVGGSKPRGFAHGLGR